MRTALNLAAALALAALAVACQTQEQAPPIEEALPSADAVAIKLPDQNPTSLALGQLSDYYLLTRTVSRDLNTGAGWVLILVHTVVQFPVTTVDGNVYTWGPWDESALAPAVYRLVVTANDDGSFDWSLDGRNKTSGEGFLTVISGHAVPGAEPYHGTGDFTVDFDAGERVNPIDNNPDTGNVSVTYDLENRDGTAAFVTMHAEGVDDLGNPGSFDYYYDENLDRSGDFQFALDADVQNDGSAAEQAFIRSRWLPTGAGRADAMVSGGDLGDLSAAATECWDEQYRRVYYTDTAAWQPTEGDAGACAYSTAAPPEIGQ